MKLIGFIINWINKKIAKRKLKKRGIIQTYGYEIKKYKVLNTEVKYAQWLHPNESLKIFSDDKVEPYKAFIEEGSFVIDIGAHTGDTVLTYAIVAGKSGTVLALEPNPYVFEILNVNSKLNDSCAKIINLNIAATEADGEYEFNYSDNGFCNGGNLSVINNKRHKHNFSLKVKGQNLSHLLKTQFSSYLPNLSFLKTDTEGYDYYVLKSLEPIIKEHKPKILCEFLRKLDENERIRQLNYLNSLSYDVYFFDEKTGQKSELVTPANIMNHAHFDALALPRKSM